MKSNTLAKIKKYAALGLRYDDPIIEKEYNKIKIPTVSKFSLILLTLFFFSMIAFAIISETRVIKDSSVHYIALAVVALICLIFYKKLRNYLQEICIIVLVCAYAFTMDLERTLLPKQNQITTFYVGYSYALCHILVQNYLFHYHYVLAFDISLLLLRTLLVNTGDIKLYITNVVVNIIILVCKYQRERAERRLFKDFFNYRDGLKKFKQLLSDYLPDGVGVIGINRKQLFCNASLLSLFQDLDPQSEHLDITDFLHYFKPAHPNSGNNPINLPEKYKDLDSVEPILTTFLESSMTDKITFHAHTKDFNGRKRLHEIKMFWVLWDGVKAVTLLINDITHQETILALRVADANKDKVIASVSHELRTPINGLVGMLDIMSHEITDKNALTKIAQCKNVLMLLSNIVNSIIDFQAVRKGKLKLNLKKTDVRAIIQEAHSMLWYQAFLKKVELKIHVAKTLQRHIHTDKERLLQILVNIIGNAVKFTYTGYISVSVERSMEDPQRVHFEVEDTGIGMSQEQQDNLFKFFGKIDTHEVGTEGSGMGLAMAHGLVAQLDPGQNHGKINVQSTEGKGSKFSFDIKDMSGMLDEAEYASGIFEEDIVEEVNPKLRPFRRNYSKFLLESGDPKEYKIFWEESMKIMKPNMASNIGDDPAFASSEQNSVHEHQKVSILTSNFSSIIGGAKINRLVAKNDKALEQLNKMAEDKEIEEMEKFQEITEEYRVLEKTVEKPPRMTRVLAVDDVPLNLLIVTKFLTKFGFVHGSALNGKLAVESAKEAAMKGEGYDVVLMDLQMPVMDGYQASIELKKLMAEKIIPEAKIYAISANDRDEDKKRCEEVGMNGFLGKPVLEKNFKEFLERNNIKPNLE